jgi:hypothetical protein
MYRAQDRDAQAHEPLTRTAPTRPWAEAAARRRTRSKPENAMMPNRRPAPGASSPVIESESADPVGDGHSDADYAAQMPPPDRPNPSPDKQESPEEERDRERERERHHDRDDDPPSGPLGRNPRGAR